jgi:hypothetical protein
VCEELKRSPKRKDMCEYNALKTELTKQPNTNKEIKRSIMNRAIKSKYQETKIKK